MSLKRCHQNFFYFRGFSQARWRKKKKTKKGKKIPHPCGLKCKVNSFTQPPSRLVQSLLIFFNVSKGFLENLCEISHLSCLQSRFELWYGVRVNFYEGVGENFCKISVCVCVFVCVCVVGDTTGSHTDATRMLNLLLIQASSIMQTDLSPERANIMGLRYCFI